MNKDQLPQNIKDLMVKAEESAAKMGHKMGEWKFDEKGRWVLDCAVPGCCGWMFIPSRGMNTEGTAHRGSCPMNEKQEAEAVESFLAGSGMEGLLILFARDLGEKIKKRSTKDREK